MMNAPNELPAVASRAALMTGDDYRESLRRLRPVVYVDGQRIDSVADAPALRPGAGRSACFTRWPSSFRS